MSTSPQAEAAAAAPACPAPGHPNVTAATPHATRVAVVGSGITGLATAWLLHKAGARVTLFEKEPTPGGHTLTDDSLGFPVDLGFQVYNMTTYPHLVGFFEELGIRTEPSDMSFSLSVSHADGSGGLEWGSHGLGSLFAQRANAASPSFLRMVADVLRFGRTAPEVLDPASPYATLSFGDYLKARRFSDAFIKNYALPMCAAVWSVPAATVLGFPAAMLVRFWVNHHLLDLTQRPVWRVVAGRSRTYVQAVCTALPDVRAGCAVDRVEPAGAGGAPPRVFGPRLPPGGEAFDAVVLATHSDTALRLIGGADGPAASGPCASAAAALGAIPYADNALYLHTDASVLMPSRRAAWASWNCVSRRGGGAPSDDPAADTSAVCVTYWVNSLQRLPPGAPDCFVTLNPPPGCEPSPGKTARRLTLAHPVFGPATPAAQAAIASANATEAATSRLYFAGAWAGYGFHEDGMAAAVRVASLLTGGAPPPWSARITRSPSPKLGLLDRAAIAAFDAFAKRAVRVGKLSLILPNGAQLDYGQVGTPESDLSPPGVPAWRGAPPRSATIRILDAAFFKAVATRHDTGLGESYMRREWECADAHFGGLMAVLAANAPFIEAARGSLGPLNYLGDKLLAAAHAARSNTRDGSRSNIEAHYDAGNAMYRLFLDETMTYSSGIHSPDDDALPGRGAEGGFGDAGLAQAQHRKLDALLAAASLRPGDHVLEIGCGWGSLAIRACSAMPSLRWTGLTLSKQQLEEGIARVEAAGLSDRVSLLLCDYRDCGPPPGASAFDAVLSCEMVEAVGHEHLPSYFASIGRLLRPGGRAVLQAISVPDGRYAAYTASSDFIREHIFPGGHLVSMGALAEAANAVGSGLTVCSVRDIGPDYAQTLRAWRAAWERRVADVRALGYPDAWWRKWRFYFAYCEAAFDARYIHDYQVTFVKGDGGAGASGSGRAAGGVDGPAPAVAAAPSSPARSLSLPAALLLALASFWAGKLVGAQPDARVGPAILLIAAAVLPAVAAKRGGAGGGVSIPATAAVAPAHASSLKASALAAKAVQSLDGALVTDHEHEE